MVAATCSMLLVRVAELLCPPWAPLPCTMLQASIKAIDTTCLERMGSALALLSSPPLPVPRAAQRPCSPCLAHLVMLACKPLALSLAPVIVLAPTYMMQLEILSWDVI